MYVHIGEMIFDIQMLQKCWLFFFSLISTTPHEHMYICIFIHTHHVLVSREWKRLTQKIQIFFHLLLSPLKHKQLSTALLIVCCVLLSSTLSHILRSYLLNIFWRICASCHSPLIRFLTLAKIYETCFVGCSTFILLLFFFLFFFLFLVHPATPSLFHTRPPVALSHSLSFRNCTFSFHTMCEW